MTPVSPSSPAPAGDEPSVIPMRDAWRALTALCIGFFMMLVDQTVVAVASPALITDLGASYNEVIWVTSAFLLAFVVPLPVTGRLGDQLGQRTMVLAGLVAFTIASALCGLASTPTQLIVARALQGLGAAMLAPQSMSVITRVFPRARRGAAMGVWGAVAGIATLVGPLLGGPLVADFGWQSVFFVNLPFGVLAVFLCLRWVPHLPVHVHSYDVPGIIASTLGLLLLVVGIQEGEAAGWGPGILAVSVSGVLVLAWFVWWQRRTPAEPLIPPGLFRDRNFSLGTIAIFTMGFTVTGIMVPIMLYAQEVRGMSPFDAALLLVPMAVVAGIAAPFAGRLTDASDPRLIGAIGYGAMIIGLVWLWLEMRWGSPTYRLYAPFGVLGVANGFAWSPTSSTATRDLPASAAGAGAGVFNTSRQVGAVLGSAAVGAVLQARLVDGAPGAGPADSLLLPVAVMGLGLCAVLSFSNADSHGDRADARR